MRDVVNNYTYTGAVRRRQPNHSGDLQRIRQTSDGYISPNPGIGTGLDWSSYVEFLGAPELDDEKFGTPSARLANAEELGELMDRYFLSRNKLDVFYAAHKRRKTRPAYFGIGAATLNSSAQPSWTTKSLALRPPGSPTPRSWGS